MNNPQPQAFREHLVSLCRRFRLPADQITRLSNYLIDGNRSVVLRTKRFRRFQFQGEVAFTTTEPEPVGLIWRERQQIGANVAYAVLRADAPGGNITITHYPAFREKR